MAVTALRSLLFLAGLTSAGATLAADTAVSTALERWEADKTVLLSAEDVDLDAFLWRARPVIVFADSVNDPAFRTQIELLMADLDELAERDIVLITDTLPDDPSALRTKLRPRGFMLTLIGKDGGVKLRKPFPWDVRELSRQIDKMPMRRQEILDAKAAAANGG